MKKRSRSAKGVVQDAERAWGRAAEVEAMEEEVAEEDAACEEVSDEAESDQPELNEGEEAWGGGSLARLVPLSPSK